MPRPPLPPIDHALVLYDGVCNLCDRTVHFILHRDPRGVFRFAALQSRLGQEVLAAAGLPPDELDTMLLVDGGRIRTKSSAALRVARRLRFPWPLWAVFLLLPKPLRDALYRFVARNRYRWFGRKDRCMSPSPDVRSRFLDWEEASGEAVLGRDVGTQAAAPGQRRQP